MTTARDFLADNGLAIRGVRGKFSNEAKAFLNKAISEGKKFQDWDANGRIMPVRVKRETKGKTTIVNKTVIKPMKNSVLAAKPILNLADAKPVREENTLRIIDKAGYTINLDSCHTCTKGIRNCRCSNITPPAFLDAREWSLVVR